MAEWSKALAPAILWRGFESHRCQLRFINGQQLLGVLCCLIEIVLECGILLNGVDSETLTLHVGLAQQYLFI